MKRAIIFSLTLFLSYCAFSQMSVTFKNNAPIPGDSSTYIKVPFSNPGDAGPEQVWDFSKITINGEKMISAFTAGNLKNEKNSNDFNITLNEGGSDYHFNLTKDHFMEVSGITKDYTLNFNDPMVKMIYPFSYGNHFTDNFAGVAATASGQKVEFNGIYLVSADAYGTLIFPNHTYENVLRLKAETNGLEISQCNTVETKTVRYAWYASDYRYPLLNVVETERTISGRETEKTTYSMVWAGKNSDTTSGKGQPQDITAKDDIIVVYVNPNPFSDKLNYKYFLRKPAPVSISLTDITGRTFTVLMKNQVQPEGLHSGFVNASDFSLNPGMYYIRFGFDKQIVVKKVIKL